jgi:TonB family protein
MTRKALAVFGVLAITSLLTLPVFAQTAPADEGATERAKRQAENPFKWIIMQDDKPRAKSAAAAQAEKEKKEKAAAAASASTAAPTAKPAPAPEPAPAAVAQPAPQVVQPKEVVVTPPPAPAPKEVAVITPPPAPAPAPVEEDEALKPLKQVAPELTRDLITKGITQGLVRVRFTVTPDGNVDNPEVVNTTSRYLNNTVLYAVKQWKFAPIKKPQTISIEFAFKQD